MLQPLLPTTFSLRKDIMNCSLQVHPYEDISNFSCNVTSNETTQATNKISSSINFESFRILHVVLYSTIIFFGVAGNCLIVSVVIRWKAMRTPCNILISNISVADIIYLLIAASLRIIEKYVPWPFGEIACPLIAPLQDVFVCVSVVTHSAIAWERQRALVTPFKPKITFKLTLTFLVVAWGGCYLTAGLPAALVYELIDFSGVLYCVPRWSKLYKRVYVTTLISLFIAVQVIIQTFAYIQVIKVLYFHDDVTVKASLRQDSQISTNSHDTHGRSARSSGLRSSTTSCRAWLIRRKKKEKMVKMLLVQVATFQACWLFRGVVLLIGEYWFSPNYFIGWVSVLLFYVQQVANPLILFSMSTDFRVGVKKNCLRVCKVCKRTSKKDEFGLERARPLNPDPTPEENC